MEALESTAPNTRTRASQAVRELISFIERNISQGVWPAGTQLPTERELEKSLGISRNTIRRGLQALIRSGRIERHVGRGSFVSATTTPAAAEADQVEEPALGDRIRGASPAEVMETRLIVEPAIAALAARRATAEDLAQMDQCLERSEAAGNLREFERWDGSLHLSIMAAGKNSLVADLLKAVNEVRAQPQWEALKARSVTAERRAMYMEQHRAIVQSIKERDPAGASAAVVRHLQAVRSHMFDDIFD